LTDVGLFGKQWSQFVFTDEDFTERVDVGVNSGLVRAKGVTSDMEVLTSRGWLLFPEVRDILLDEREQFISFNSLVAGAKSLGVSGGGVDLEGARNRFNYEPLLVASVSPYQFDEVGKKRLGQSGRLVFVQPSGFHQWLYARSVVRVKMRGIDARMTPFLDVVAKRKYRPGYGFVKANDMYENRYGEYFYLGLNKFSRSIGETFTPGKAHIMDVKVLDWWEDSLRKAFGGSSSVGRRNILEGFVNRVRVDTTNSFRANSGLVPGLDDVVSSFLPNVVVPTEVFVEGRGAEIVPADYVTRYSGYNDFVFNVTVEPYHTIVVRKHKPDESERKWVGKPFVVGDYSNKDVPANGSYLKRSLS
jgi:hypothetical protein